MDTIIRNQNWKRFLHLTHLLSTLVLYYTGFSWYFPSWAELIGGYPNVMLFHRIAAAIFLGVPLIMLVVYWRKVAEFVGDLTHWTGPDSRWMLKFPSYIIKHKTTRMPYFEGKYNPGQRFSGSIQVGLCFLLGATGLLWALGETLGIRSPWVMEWLNTAHLGAAVVLLIFLLGHIYLGAGLFRPYRGMVRTMFGDGRIDKEKARRIWPQWTEEMEKQGK